MRQHNYGHLIAIPYNVEEFEKAVSESDHNLESCPKGRKKATLRVCVGVW